MFERSLLALALIVIAIAGYSLLRRRQLYRLRSHVSSSTPGLQTFRRGVAGVLYFTTPDCVPCLTIQRPALTELRSELEGELQVIEIDASRQPEIADHWRVLSVPTTFVLDGSGAPRYVNHGVTRSPKLRRQLDDVARHYPNA